MAERIILIRHGEPAATPVGTFLGRTNPGLGSEGQAQAEQLGAILPKLLLDGAAAGSDPANMQCFVSPLLRAQETAAPITAALGIDAVTVDELAEIDFGAWDGLTMPQINERWDGAGSRWLADPIDHQPPGGESLRQVGDRVDHFWRQRVAKQTGGAIALRRPGAAAQCSVSTILVVAHFGPLCWLGGALLGLPASQRTACRLRRGQAGCIEDGVLRWWGVPTDAGGFF